MKKLFYNLIAIAFLNTTVFAQEKIDTDRPDQTESSYLVPKGYFQGEFGFNIENDKKLKTFVHPTGLWKYGINKRFELRLITEFVSQETVLILPQGNKFETGLVPIQIGSKIALWEEKGIIPKTSLIFHIGIPGLSSSKFKTPNLAPNFRFTMSHSLSERVGLGYNLGAEWDGIDETPAWIYTIAPGINIGNNWYAYIEAFGSIKKNEPAQHSVDAGLAYFFSNNTKIDISSGFGISKTAPDNYVAIGFSFRFKTKK